MAGLSGGPPAPLIIALGDSGSLKSTDGVSWSSLPAIGGNAIAYNGSMWVSVGNSGSCETSPDGITWTSRLNATTNFGTRTMTGVAWSPTLNRWVATASAAIGVFYSDDGINWTNVTPAGASSPAGVAWLSTLSMFCAVGSNWSATSLDGITWTNRTFSGSNYAPFWASGLGLAISPGGNTKTTPNPSTTAWTTRVSGGFYNKLGGAYSPSLNRAVIVGDSLGVDAMYSNDGITWNNGVFTGSRELKAACWSAALGKFLAVGSGGSGLSSSDGINWTALSTASGINLTSIASTA